MRRPSASGTRVDSEAVKAPLAGVGRATAPRKFLTFEGQKEEAHVTA